MEFIEVVFLNDNPLEQISKINGTSLEGLSLKDARKLVESAKERLELVVKRTKQERPNNNNLDSKPMNGYARPIAAATPPRPPPPNTEDGCE